MTDLNDRPDLAQYAIPPRLRWSGGTNYPPQLPAAALLDRYCDADTQQRLGEYRDLTVRFAALHDQLGTLDPAQAHRDDEQARARAFRDNTDPPATTEPAVLARIEELRAELATARNVCFAALRRAAESVLANRVELLERISSDARGELPRRLTKLRDRVHTELDELLPVLALGGWVREIDARPEWYAPNAAAASDRIDAAFATLLSWISDESDRVFAPIPIETPTTGDVLEYHGAAAAKAYAEAAKRKRTTQWIPGA